MFSIFRAITDRVKAMFAVHVAQELEAEFLDREAERRATLLRTALRYEKEGLHEVARTLRQRATALDTQQPLAALLPTVAHLGSGDASMHGNRAIASPSSTTALARRKKKGEPS